jgi:hypothetical protein
MLMKPSNFGSTWFPKVNLGLGKFKAPGFGTISFDLAI